MIRAPLWLPIAIYCVGIFLLSSLTSEEVPTFYTILSDKIAHVMLYAGLGFLVARYFKAARRTATGFTVVFAGLFCLLYGITDEFHQAFVPGRSAEVGDLIADLVGGLIGGLLYAALSLSSFTDSRSL
jgi:VanZ family protein